MSIHMPEYTQSYIYTPSKFPSFASKLIRDKRSSSSDPGEHSKLRKSAACSPLPFLLSHLSSMGSSVVTSISALILPLCLCTPCPLPLITSMLVLSMMSIIILYDNYKRHRLPKSKMQRPRPAKTKSHKKEEERRH